MQLSPTRWDGAFNRLRGLSCPLLCLSKVQRDEQLSLTAVKRIVKCFGKAIFSNEEKLESHSTNNCSWEAEKQLLTSPKEFFGAPLTIPGIRKGLIFCHIAFSCDTSPEQQLIVIESQSLMHTWYRTNVIHNPELQYRWDIQEKKLFCLWPCKFWSYFCKGLHKAGYICTVKISVSVGQNSQNICLQLLQGSMSKYSLSTEKLEDI